jgi:phage shock protein C
MPKGDPIPGQSSIEQGAKQFSDEVAQLGQHLSQEASRLGREVLVSQRQGQSQARGGAPTQAPPTPPEYRFDPLTGQPLGPDSPSTGQTVNLTPPPAELPTQYTPQGNRRARNWNTLGLILIGIGALVFLEQFGIDMSLIVPALLIVAGVILMRRKR